jgi:hemerythrin
MNFSLFNVNKQEKAAIPRLLSRLPIYYAISFYKKKGMMTNMDFNAVPAFSPISM